MIVLVDVIGIKMCMTRHVTGEIASIHAEEHIKETRVGNGLTRGAVNLGETANKFYERASRMKRVLG